jgi:hypothetical protein
MRLPYAFMPHQRLLSFRLSSTKSQAHSAEAHSRTRPDRLLALEKQKAHPLRWPLLNLARSERLFAACGHEAATSFAAPAAPLVELPTPWFVGRLFRTCRFVIQLLAALAFPELSLFRSHTWHSNSELGTPPGTIRRFKAGAICSP